MSNLQGTTVPSNAFVEKVYINVDLSIEEVVSIIDSANLTYNFSSKYTVVDGIEISNILGKTIIVNNEVVFRESDSMNTGFFVGWKEGFNGIVAVNKQNSYGTQNDALSSLFSITPLTQPQEGQVIVSKSKLTAIADNIRNQTGATGLITLDEMAKMKLGGGATITTKGGWSGTTVPNTGYVENVYFNTNLSVDEVVSIIDNAILAYQFDQMEIIITEDGNNLTKTIIVAKIDTFIFIMVDNVFVFSNEINEEFDVDFVGWKSDFNGIYEFNDIADSFDTSDVGTITFGANNDKLSSLFSITPFVKATGEEVLLEGEYDGSSVEITELPKGGWIGTVVPNSGYVENVYLNTNLSIEEVVSILGDIEYQTISGLTGTHNLILSNESFGIISIMQNDGVYGVYNMDTNVYYFISADVGLGFTGWNTSVTFPLAINAELLADVEGIPIGTQNDKISSLFSITPFVQSEANTINIKQYIENKQIPLKIKVDVETGITPTGTYQVTENGEYDITEYAKVNVNVASSGGDTSQEDGLIDGTITSYSNNRVTNVTQCAFYYNKTLINIDLPQVTNIDSEAFRNCSNLTNINLSQVTTIGDYAFNHCEKLTNINLSQVTSIGNYAFQYCYAFKSIVLPLIKSVSSYFQYCENLTNIDLPQVTTIDNAAFKGCYTLKAIIIRQENQVCSLSNINALSDCYHLTGDVSEYYNPNGDKDGFIYVPDSLVNDYKQATNWSTYADQIRSMFNVDYIGSGIINETTNNSNETILSATPNEGNTFIGWYNGLPVIINLVVGSVETNYTPLEVTYPLTLNDSGYYQNTNQTKKNTFSIGRFNFNIENENQKLRITYLQSSENGYDYGVIGNVDTALDQSTNTTGYRNLKGKNNTTPEEIFIDNISVGNHFIDIKYIKDSGGDKGTDTLQVKVDVVTINVKEEVNGTLYSTENEINIGVVDEQTMQPLNLVAVFEEV